jgi:methylenetetrahydrofolate reductase (NADPH)
VIPQLGGSILDDISLGMSARDARRISESALWPGASVNVGHLGGETTAQRLAAIRHLRALRLRPVAHISARRVPSTIALESFLGQLEAQESGAHVFLVGGDPKRSLGPYPDALGVLRSGVLSRHGVRAVSVAGYPEGHPALSTSTLWDALERKCRLLREQGRAGDIISQLSLDPTAAVAWIEEVRDRGIDVPIRVGIPGPVRSETLIGYVRRYGGRVDPQALREFGLDAQRPRSTVTADRLVDSLAARLDPSIHGQVRLHVFGFGDVAATTEWMGRLAAPIGV